METHYLFEIGLVLLLGVGAQLMAWRLKLPAILILLFAGLIAGPVLRILHPYEVFGEMMLPLVSLCVAVILFDGGLNLKLHELGDAGRLVRNLVTVGVGVTWLTTFLGAKFIIGLDTQLALLLGAILIVTGPTVIMPLLRHVKPVRRISSAAKWEGILNDPIGAIIAVLVFEVIAHPQDGNVFWATVINIGTTVLIAGGLSAAAVAVTVWLMRHRLLPDFLHTSFSLMIVVFAFALSNRLQHESGLLTVTLMGILMANQKVVSIRHIVEFKESLSTLLISTVFIVLAAKISLSDFRHIGFSSILFLVFLLVVSRPLMVYASSRRSGYTLNELLYLSWMAPRGVVAAAVSAVFAIRLEELGFEQAKQLVPITFVVIIGTVVVYGLSAAPLAHLLGLARRGRGGALIMGAPDWAQDMAALIKERGIDVTLVDTNRDNVASARLRGLNCIHGNLLSDDLEEEKQLEGMGFLLAMTPNDEVNSLAALHFMDRFGRDSVYQLPSENQKEQEDSDKDVSSDLRGRTLFGADYTYEMIEELSAIGGHFKSTQMSPEFTFKQFREMYQGQVIPLFAISGVTVEPFTLADNPKVENGDTIISLAMVEPLPPEKIEEAKVRQQEAAGHEQESAERDA